MARHRKADRPRKRTISIPTSIDNKVEKALLDPVTEQRKPGALSSLVERLLREWLEKNGY